MKIEVNVGKIHLFVIIGLVFLFGASMIVYAYNSSPANPSVMGHSTNEIDWTPASVPISSISWATPINNTAITLNPSSSLFFRNTIGAKQGSPSAWTVRLSESSGTGKLQFSPSIIGGPLTQDGYGYWIPDSSRAISFSQSGVVTANDFCSGAKCLNNASSGVSAPPNCASGQYLTYQNNAWSCVTPTSSGYTQFKFVSNSYSENYGHCGTKPDCGDGWSEAAAFCEGGDKDWYRWMVLCAQ